MSIERFWAFAKQYFFHRSLPHGIVHWQYLLPNPPSNVRIHRQLWLLGKPSRMPISVFFLMELILWLRWVLFAAWFRSWKAVQFRGAVVYQQEGINKGFQLKDILIISISHCIPPAEIYAFGLYRSNSKQAIWDYVFAQESQAFHLWRNTRLGASQASISLLQDKYELAKQLTAQGISMAPVLGLVMRNDHFDPSVYLRQKSKIFCKPRHGSHSRDSFVIEARGIKEKPAVFAAANGIQTQPSSLEKLQPVISLDDSLIQPFMDNHPVLAALSPTKDAITLRIITEVHPLYG